MYHACMPVLILAVFICADHVYMCIHTPMPHCSGNQEEGLEERCQGAQPSCVDNQRCLHHEIPVSLVPLN